jgi:hypothetical protein
MKWTLKKLENRDVKQKHVLDISCKTEGASETQWLQSMGTGRYENRKGSRK